VHISESDIVAQKQYKHAFTLLFYMGHTVCIPYYNILLYTIYMFAYYCTISSCPNLERKHGIVFSISNAGMKLGLAPRSPNLKRKNNTTLGSSKYNIWNFHISENDIEAKMQYKQIKRGIINIENIISAHLWKVYWAQP